MVSLYLAAKNVTRKKERSILTIIGVLLAVGAFISLLSIAEGMYRKVQRELDGREVDIYVIPSNAVPMPVGPLGGVGLSTETIPETVVQALSTLGNVKLVEPVTRFQQLEQGRSVIIWALRPTSYEIFLPYLRVSQGRPPAANNEILVGPALARELNLVEGATITVARRDLVIVGIFDPTSSLQDYFCYVTPEAAKEITGRGAQEVWVKLNDPTGRDVIAREDINEDKERRFADYLAMTREQYLGAAEEYISYAWLLQFAVAAIGVLIAMTAAMNTMLMSTYERLKEFGTLRAIGASRLTVVGMITAESLILSTIGGLFGVVLGVMGSQLLDSAVVTLFKLTFPIASITLQLVLQALVLSVVVGLVGAIIPAFLVYRMNIIQGLRQE